MLSFFSIFLISSVILLNENGLISGGRVGEDNDDGDEHDVCNLGGNLSCLSIELDFNCLHCISANLSSSNVNVDKESVELVDFSAVELLLFNWRRRNKWSTAVAL